MGRARIGGQVTAEAGVRGRERGGTGSGFADDLRRAAWLAGADIRKSWVSFPVAAVVCLLPGFYATFLFAEALGGSSRLESLLLDYWFLLVVAVLNVNFLFNRDYYYRFSEDNYTKRLSFLRGLPISPRTVVAGRAMVMAVALSCSAPSFFLVPYLVDPGIRATMGPAGYLWFAGVWVGYALFAMGFLLFMWNGLSWRAERGLLWLFPASVVVAALVSGLLFDDGLVLAAVRAAQTHGPLAAGTAILFGVLSLALWARAAEAGLRGRDLG